MRRSSLLLSLAFVVLACSACTLITGVPAKPCTPDWNAEAVPLSDSTGVVVDTALVFVGYCR